MSVATRITITKDSATPAVDALLAKCTTKRLGVIVGPALTRLTQDHLRANGQNKKGWPTTHFWADAARATSWQLAGDYVFITVNKIGVRQRYYGGTISPVRAKALAIPISPVSYGHVPADFPGLFLLVCRKGAYLVQPGEEVSEKSGRLVKRKKNAGGNVSRRSRASLNFLFKLAGGVDQPPDPGCIPTAEKLQTAAKARIIEALSA